jgi:hypothetical protein
MHSTKRINQRGTLFLKNWAFVLLGIIWTSIGHFRVFGLHMIIHPTLGIILWIDLSRLSRTLRVCRLRYPQEGMRCFWSGLCTPAVRLLVKGHVSGASPRSEMRWLPSRDCCHLGLQPTSDNLGIPLILFLSIYEAILMLYRDSDRLRADQGEKNQEPVSETDWRKTKVFDLWGLSVTSIINNASLSSQRITPFLALSHGFLSHDRSIAYFRWSSLAWGGEIKFPFGRLTCMFLLIATIFLELSFRRKEMWKLSERPGYLYLKPLRMICCVLMFCHWA